MNKTLQRLLLVFAVTALFTNGAFAQGGEVKAKGEVHPSAGDISTPVDISVNKQDYSGWQYPVDAALTIGTSINRYVSFLFEDSSAVWVPDPGSGGSTYHYPWHSVGAAFDPSDVNLEVVDDGIRLDRFHEYTVDSVYMPYIYVRYVDSVDLGSGNEYVVDTLIFQFFNYQDFQFSSFTGSNGPERYAKPTTWSPSKLGSPTSRYEVKIPLTSMDSTPVPSATGWLTQAKYFEIPNIVIPADPALQGRRVCGFSVTFKSMVPRSFGDTMESRDPNSTPVKRLNYFGHSMYLNEGTEVLQTEYFNNSWWVPSEIRYGGTLNGWTNSVPGNAYFDDRYVYYAIHITDATIGVSDINENMKIAIYPNPVSKSQLLKLDFALVNADNVEIALYDLLGNKVKTVASGYYTSGEHQIDLNISDLPAGVYVYSIQAGNVNTAKKITITE